jgi:hypothetical protein
MNPNDQQSDNEIGASLQLPDNAHKPQDANPAADLVRQKVQAAYANEPDAVEDAIEVAEMGPVAKHSKHQSLWLRSNKDGMNIMRA